MKEYADFELGRMPPQSIDFEEAVLGACMLESTAFEEIQDILSPESFYKDQNQKIYRAIYEMFSEGGNIDMLTIIEKLREKNILDEIGGPAYVSKLTTRIASSAHIEFHARIVQQKFLRRELIRISSEIQKKAYDESIDISDIIDYSESYISKITTQNIKKEAKKLGEIGRERIQEYEELSKKEIKTIGVPFFGKFNKFMGGWQKPDLIIIGARPANGKTRMAQEISEIAAINNDPVLIYQLEMSDKQIYDRHMSAETGIENMALRQAIFDENDWNKIENAQTKFENLPIYIDDNPSLTTSRLRSSAKYYKKKFGISLIIIDYIQLMSCPEFKFNKVQEVSEISRVLKLTAKELDIPIIALSQLSRKIEDRHDKRPMLSDLRDSGSLEQDSDIVIFLHRPELYEDDEDCKNKIEWIFAKHRNGSTGVLNTYRSEKWTTIYESRGQYEQDLRNIDEIPY